MVKLIDVKTELEYKFKCDNCNKKLKNVYICDNNLNLGCECIIKVFGDDLSINEDLSLLNSKLKKLKFILNKCSYVLVSDDVLKNINNKKEYEDYFYFWIYDNKENFDNFASFKYRITLKGLKDLWVYFSKNKNIKYINDKTNKEIKLSEVLL